MKIRKLLVLSLVSSACYSQHGMADSGSKLVLNLKGPSTGYETFVPDVNGDGIEDPAVCYDVKVFDLAKDKQVGVASDCFSYVEANEHGGIKSFATTIFKLREGSFRTSGKATVQPVLHGSEGITHITGLIPSSAKNGIFDGTGKFSNAEGTVRLSGAVNLSDEPSGLINFDCIFVVDII